MTDLGGGHSQRGQSGGHSQDSSCGGNRGAEGAGGGAEIGGDLVGWVKGGAGCSSSGRCWKANGLV